MLLIYKRVFYVLFLISFSIVHVVQSKPEFVTLSWNAMSNFAPTDRSTVYTYRFVSQHGEIIRENMVNDTTITLDNLQCDTEYNFTVAFYPPLANTESSAVIRTGIPGR